MLQTTSPDQKVYKEYKIWEDENLEKTWEIQSVSRGEIDESLRTELKLILGKIRDIDFDVLNRIYENIKNDIGDIQKSAFMEEQRRQKNQLNQKALELVDEYYNLEA